MQYTRQGAALVMPFSMRDGIVTAAATLTTGTNTILLTGDSDYLLDCIEVTFANQSTVAAQVTLKDDGTSVKTLEVPLGNSFELVPNYPILQGKKGGTWSVDMEDITGTTVVVEAMFMKRIP